MSLYGKTDSAANLAKAGRGVAASSQAKTIVFVDNKEAALAENKARGINAPGWWSYFTYTDGEGNVRHKAEMLVTIAGPDTNANETQSDDAIAADRTMVVANSPQDVTVAAGQPAQFVVAAATEPDSVAVSFHWEVSTDGGANWTSLNSGQATGGGGTTYGSTLGSTLDINNTGLGMDGYQYRCALTAAGVSATTFSDAATLTVE
jgi:hypothetical protein